MALKLGGELSLDGSGWKKGLGLARSGLDELKNHLAAAFSIGAIEEMTRKTIEYAGKINDLSDRLGVSTDYLQEMQFLLKSNGGSVEDLTTLFEKLGAARIAALGGDEKAQGNFAKLGVSMGDLQTKGTSGLLDTIAAQFKQLGNNDEIKTAFKEVGGKGAGILVPSFISGLEDGRKKAQDAGAVIAADTIIQLDDIGDKFDEIGIQLMAQTAPAIIAFADAVQYFTDHLGQSQSALGEFIGNIWGIDKAVFGGDLKRQAENFKKYKEQLHRRVDSGEITNDRAKSMWEAATKNFSFFTELKDGIWDGVTEALEKTEKQQGDAHAAAAAERQAKIAARNGDKTSFGLTPTIVKNNAAEKPYTDSLVRIGNFLGASGRSGVQEIARRQLDLTISIDKTLKDIAKNKGGDQFGAT